MAGASGGVMGVDKVARETLDANVRPEFRKASDWIHEHGRLPRTKYLLEVPRSFLNKVFVVALGLSYGALWFNRRMFTSTVVSMEPEFQEKARRIGPIAERTDAPPVFLNPITNRIPGWCIGPEDVPK